MKIQKIFLTIIIFCITTALTAQKFIKEKKASSASRQECAQHIAEQIKICAQLMEDLAKMQQVLLTETVAYIENSTDALLVTINGKTDLATLQTSVQELSDAMRTLDKKVKSNMVSIEAKKSVVTA